MSGALGAGASRLVGAGREREDKYTSSGSLGYEWPDFKGRRDRDRSQGTAIARPAFAPESIFVGGSDFDHTAFKRMMEWSKWAAVAAAGTLERNAWADREIEECRDWRLIAHEVSSEHPARGRRESVAGEALR
jgi:hypothetical protein